MIVTNLLVVVSVEIGEGYRENHGHGRPPAPEDLHIVLCKDVGLAGARPGGDEDVPVERLDGPGLFLCRLSLAHVFFSILRLSNLQASLQGQ